MLESLKNSTVKKRPDQVTLSGRVLFLAEDADLVRRQLEGEDLDWPQKMSLRDDISTDEITPAYRWIGKQIFQRCVHNGVSPFHTQGIFQEGRTNRTLRPALQQNAGVAFHIGRCAFRY